MNSNQEPDALRSRWELEGSIPLSGVADGAQWRRARSVATGQDVVLFIVQGEAALEAADAVRRAYLVEDPRLLPVQEIVVLDDPRDAEEDEPSAGQGPTTVVEYPLPPSPPLAALLARGPLHPETARAIIGEVATGLEAARRRGVRHQFIDSNRVFVNTRSGAVSILGIGVEAAAHSGLDRSREVASFQDAAALVALLYRALTGRSPQQDASGNVPRPSTLIDTEIPVDLDLLCDLVLNESSEEIPETTRGLIEALEPWQSIPVTLEAYPRNEPRAAEPQDLDQQTGAAEGVEEADGSDALERTALMEATPDAEREHHSGSGAASAAGALGAAGPADGTNSPEAPTGEPAGSAGSADSHSTAAADSVDHLADDAAVGAVDGEPDGAAVDAGETSRSTSAEAKALVEELRLDEKRGNSPFPGHLDITPPREPRQETARAPEKEPESSDSGSGSGSDSHAAGAAGAAALGAGAGAVAAASLPSRTSGTQWPLSDDEGQGAPQALSPDPDRTGSAAGAVRPTSAVEAATPDHDAPTPASPSSATESGPRTAALSEARADGPIVVHGRDRSLLEEEPEERTLSSTRSSLLRDVVGVAVDADAPGTYTLGPRDQEKRSLQSQWIIIGGAILVMIALVFALTSISRGIRDVAGDPLATSQAPVSAKPAEDTGEAPVEPTPENTEEPELPAPEIAGLELFAQGSDTEPDHTDQQAELNDGDPATFWSTKHYKSPDYSGLKDGVGIRLNFAEPSQVTAVTVATARNQGGMIELRALNDDGSLGDVLASGELLADGEVRLQPDQPVDADKVALWIPELPPDSNEAGRYRARIAEITVE